MRLWLKDNACERRLMITPQFFDRQELAVLQSVVGQGFQFVDLGANAGIYSIFVGRLAGPDARILAIEPQPAMLVRLRDNIALNNLHVLIAETAISDLDGDAEFAVDSSNLGYTSLHTERRGRGQRSIVRMRTRTLIDVVREAGFERIDALKADIEGAEDRAIIPFFEAAAPALWPELLIIEDNRGEWEQDCFAFLDERGYRRITSGGNIMLVRVNSRLDALTRQLPEQLHRLSEPAVP
jgi:FkbM family methyltransferase